MPEVSIILPTYNRASILPRAIESVLSQIFSDFELIVVDDGSVDNTEEVVRSFEDNRIRYFRHEKNKGVAAALNTGIREARGNYIAIQASDDVWLPDKLEKQVVELEKEPPNVGVAYCRLEKQMKNGSVVFLPPKAFLQKDGFLHEDILKGNFITPQVVLMRRKCFEATGAFDESPELISFEDWDYWIRVSASFSFLYIPDICVRAYVLSDSLTRDQSRRLRARIAVFEKHKEKFLRYPYIFARLSYAIGHALALRGNMGAAVLYLSQAFQTRPFHLKYVIAFILAYVGSPQFYRRFTYLYNLTIRKKREQ